MNPKSNDRMQAFDRFKQMGPTRLKVLSVVVAILIAYVFGALNELATVGLLKFTPNFFKAIGYNFIGKSLALKAIAFIAVFALLWFAVKKVDELFYGDTYDADRGFKFDESNAAGTSKWMTEEEMNSEFKIAPMDRTDGIVLARKDARNIITIPTNSRGNKHIFVQGGSGSGKSRGFVRPNVFQLIKRGESFIITDPKGEHYNDMAVMCSKAGYTVKVLNLVNPEFSDHWDCLQNIHCSQLKAQIMTQCIISNTTDVKHNGESFWDEQEGNLLTALILFVSFRREQLEAHADGDTDDTTSKDRDGFAVGTMPYLYSLLTSNDSQQLIDLMDKEINGVSYDTPHPAKMSFDIFKNMSDRVRDDTKSGLAVRLRAFQNPEIQQLMDQKGIDLVEPLRTRCAYFVIMSAQHQTFNFISALFFANMFIEMPEYCETRSSQRGELPVTFILDEFPNIGQIPDFDHQIAFVRSYGINLWVIVQSISQLKNLYPNDVWETITGNCDTMLCLGIGKGDKTSPEFFSNAAGISTITDQSVRYGRATMAVFPTVPEYNKSESGKSRNLMNPDEITSMPKNQCLIFRNNCHPIKATKIDYEEFPEGELIKNYPAKNNEMENGIDQETGKHYTGRETIMLRNEAIETTLDDIHHHPGKEIVKNPLKKYCKSKGSHSLYMGDGLKITDNSNNQETEEHNHRGVNSKMKPPSRLNYSGMYQPKEHSENTKIEK